MKIGLQKWFVEEREMEYYNRGAITAKGKSDVAV